MGLHKGRVREIRLGASDMLELSVDCQAATVPEAGQYLTAIDPYDEQAILGTPIFSIEKTSQGFWAAPLQPVTWGPGTKLELIGPLGHGFDLPGTLQRLGLVAMGETISRLLPLVSSAGETHAGITLFTDLHLPRLPAAVEAHPLGALKDALDWPDYLAVDIPLQRFGELRHTLGIPAGGTLPCPTQVLVTTSMPCTGLAQCGVCAILSRRGWKLACEAGPVFDLRNLDW